MNYPTKFNSIPYYGIITFTAVSLAVMFCLFPYCLDDYVFMSWFKTTCDGTPWPVDWAYFYKRWAWGYMNDNARLANTAACVSYIPPKWIGNIIAAAWWAVILLLMGKLAKWDKRRWDLMAILAMLLMVVPVWFDGIVVADYQLNYGWSTGFVMISLWLFLRKSDINPIFAFIFGGGVGAWHEGFSLPLVLALATLAVLHPRFRTVGRLTLIAAIGIGVFLLLRSHSTVTRSNALFSTDSHAIELTVYCAIPLILFAATSAWAIYVRRIKRVFHDPLWQALIIISIISLGIKTTVGENIRAAWPCQVFSCFGLVYVLGICTHSKFKLPMKLVGIASGAFLIVHMVAANYATNTVRKEINTIITETKRNPFRTFFLPLSFNEQLPVLALGKPCTYLHSAWIVFYDYYHIPQKENTIAKYIPDKLAHYDGNGGYTYPSGQVVNYNGYYVTDSHGKLGCEQQFYIPTTITTPLGKHTFTFTAIPFYSPVNGHTYILLRPDFVEPQYFSISDIELNWNSTSE